MDSRELKAYPKLLDLNFYSCNMLQWWGDPLWISTGVLLWCDTLFAICSALLTNYAGFADFGCSFLAKICCGACRGLRRRSVYLPFQGDKSWPQYATVHFGSFILLFGLLGLAKLCSDSACACAEICCLCCRLALIIAMCISPICGLRPKMSVSAVLVFYIMCGFKAVCSGLGLNFWFRFSADG